MIAARTHAMLWLLVVCATAYAQQFDEVLRFELDTYQVLDDRVALRGKLLPRSTPLPSGTEVYVEASRFDSEAVAWRAGFVLGDDGTATFSIPVGELKGGYYTLSGSLTEDNEVRTGGTVFCIRQLREGSPRQMKFTLYNNPHVSATKQVRHCFSLLHGRFIEATVPLDLRETMERSKTTGFQKRRWITTQ